MKENAGRNRNRKKPAWLALAKRLLPAGRLLEKQRQTVLRSGLFDEKFYVEAHPDLSGLMGTPFDHYMQVGFRENRDPNPYFSSAFYLSQNPDVAAAGLNPLLHFITHGAAEGRRPNPLFDPLYYRKTYGTIIPEDMNPLTHYIREGSRARLNPAENFDSIFYLKQNRDVAKSGQEPLLHYLRTGASEGRNADSSYRAWVRLYDTLTPENEALVTKLYRELPAKPLFSIILPVEDESAALQTLASLTGQIYAEWEALTISGHPGLSTPQDSRIRIIARGTEDPEAFNQALNQARGEFVFCPQKGEIFRPHTLAAYAQELNRKSHANLIYADHDTMAAGVRTAPAFKPDLNYDLLLESNYIGTAFAIRRDYLKDLGAFRGKAGSGHHDILLRAAARQPAAIYHIPQILHHNSTELPDETSRPALELYCADHRGAAVTLSRPGAESARLVFGLSGSPPPISLIVALQDEEPERLKTAVQSISGKTSYSSFEVLLVHGALSKEAEAGLMEVCADSRLRRLSVDTADCPPALINHAVDCACGELIVLLSGAVEITNPEWLTEMAAHALRPGVGAVGARLVDAARRCVQCGLILGAGGIAGKAFSGLPAAAPGYMQRARYRQNVSTLSSHCLMVRKALVKQAGGFDQVNLKKDFYDVDFCLKLQALGYRHLVLPDTTLLFHQCGEPAANRKIESRIQRHQEELVIRSRWGALLHKDPAYNPNLDLADAGFNLSFPPRLTPAWRKAPYDRSAFTALGRDRRLNIYGSLSNFERVEESLKALRPFERKDCADGLSVIVLTRDHPELIIPLARQLIAQQAAFTGRELGFEILIGDTGTTAEEVLRFYGSEEQQLKIRKGMRYNFSACNNELAAGAQFNALLFLNNDIILPSWNDLLLQAYTALHSSPELGCLGALMFYPDGRVQHAGCEFSSDASSWGLPYHVLHRQFAAQPLPESRFFPCVTGAFLMVKRASFEMAGGFDENYRAECQDAALCLELHRLGLKAACRNLGPVIHIENATRPKNEENWDDRRRFLRKYGAYIRSAFP